MSKKAWFFGTVATALIGIVGAETLVVYNSEQYEKALKANKGKSASVLRDGVSAAGSLVANVVRRKSAGDIEADNYRSTARLVIDAIPGDWSGPIQEIGTEGLARNMMAHQTLMNGEGALWQRLGNAFRALKDGKMPEPARGPSQWWNRLTNNDKPSPPK